MSDTSGLKVVFVAGFGPLVKDSAASKAFYVDALGLPLEHRIGSILWIEIPARKNWLI